MTANMNFGPEWMRGGFPQRSNTTNSQSTQSILSAQTLTSNFTSNKENNFVSSPSVDNPYKYSKEFMLSLYCPSAPPQQFEHLPYVAVEESLGPLAFVDLSEEEKKLLAGPVHSESSRRVIISNDKGNGQRHHRSDYHSADNNRSMNRSKGRHGLEHQHRRIASSQSDFDGSKQTDSYVDGNNNSNNNSNNNGNNNSWGGSDSLGSWDSQRNGNNHSSTLDKGWSSRSENNENVSVGWNNRSESNENDPMGWTPANSGNNGASFNSSTENGFKSTTDGTSFVEPSSIAAEKSPSQYKWYYRDPSSNVQGPFDAQEMQDWYKAGFFGPSLWIRREDQDQFEPLAALVLKVGNEDALFLSPIPKRPDFTDSFGVAAAAPPPSAASSAFPSSSDSFSRMGASNIFGNTASPGIDTHSTNFFANSTGPDLLPSGIGNKYSPFGNMLNSTPGSNGSLPMASPFSGVNPFVPAFGREPGTAPSWLSNSHPDFFGNSFQRQQQQQQQHMMNPLFQNRNVSSFNNEPMDIQQHFMSVLQRQQQQQQQHDMGLTDQSLPQQPLFGQNQVLERLSNHASPVIRPAALSGWGSSPGTPLTTEAPSSPWGSIVSPAIPHKVTEELQSKAPGQQSPRSHLSPQIHHSTLPTMNNNSSITSTTVSTAANSTTTTTPTTPTTSTSPKASSKLDIIHNDNNDFTTTTATATLNESRWDKKSNTVVEENITSSLKKVSLHEIQQEQEQEQEKNRKKEQESLKKQKEKELVEIIAKQKSEKAQAPLTATTEATPIHTKRMPEIPTVKPMSLREIQAEELKRQEELKKQAKANKVTKPTPSVTSPTSSKAGWNSGSGWNSESFKGPSLREIQEMEAKEAKLKKEAERKAAELQQQTFTSSTSSTVSTTTSTTLSWGVVTPSKSQSGTHSNTSTSAATVAWSSASAPKKTLREIQLEEEAAMKKKANKQQQQQQQQQHQAINTKVGYANVASKIVDTFDDASWTTVHNKPKPSSNNITTTTTTTTSSVKNGWDIVGAPKKPAVMNSGATSVSRTMIIQPAKKPTNGPSESFKLWCKQSLRDLNAGVNADEILKMLLSFPLDNSVNEIIQDIIYANSTSMDGRRFAAEFMKRRKADINNNDKVASTASSTIAPPSINTVEDDSFQVVNKKGRKTKVV